HAGVVRVSTLFQRRDRAETIEMKRSIVAFFWCCSAAAAALPADWQYQQQFDLAAPGLVKFSLPVETLDKSRPGLEDLRLYDAAGNELPYLIERPRPASKVTQS